MRGKILSLLVAGVALGVSTLVAAAPPDEDTAGYTLDPSWPKLPVPECISGRYRSFRHRRSALRRRRPRRRVSSGRLCQAICCRAASTRRRGLAIDIAGPHLSCSTVAPSRS